MSDLISDTADNMIHVYDDELSAAQWYFGSRTCDFYLYGIKELRASLSQYPFIDVQSRSDGDLIRVGEPAITITIRRASVLKYGNMIETLLYNTVWYRSTVGTILIGMKDTLIRNGFSVYSAFPQTGRASVNHEQTLVANEMFERVFYKLGTELRSVATHNEILMTSERFCLQNYRSVMADTYDIANFCELCHELDYTGNIMIDSSPIIENIDYVLSHTNNTISQVESITINEWHELVEHYSGNKRLTFGIGSCCFTNISRDTFGLVFKTCAIERNGKWIGVSKQTSNKKTHNGYVGKLS